VTEPEVPPVRRTLIKTLVPDSDAMNDERIENVEAPLRLGNDGFQRLLRHAGVVFQRERRHVRRIVHVAHCADECRHRPHPHISAAQAGDLLARVEIGGLDANGHEPYRFPSTTGHRWEQRDFIAYGAALEWAARPSLSLVAEVAGRAGDGMRGADQSSEARLGLRLGRGRLRGSAALRRGLLSTDGDWGATLGLTWTLRSPRP